MRADNSRHLRAAARRRSKDTRQRAVKALRRLDDGGATITFDAVAREAGVSRSWLYAQTDLRQEIERQRARHRTASAPAVPDRQRATDTSLLRRLQAASDRIHKLEHDNRDLRQALADALGDKRATRTLGRTAGRDTPGPRPPKTAGSTG